MMALSPKQRKAALEKGLTVDLSVDEKKYVNPNPRAALNLLARPLQLTEQSTVLPADRQSEQTVDRKLYRQTVSPSHRQTPLTQDLQLAAPLPADRQTEATTELQTGEIPLAPVQWAVLQALRDADADGTIVSYRRLAQAANASIRGVRDALAVIERVGGIRSKLIIRTADQQGLRIELNTEQRFRLASLKETKGLLKRGSDYPQTVDRKSPALPADRLRLSVCITDNIKQTDIADLLHVVPPTWKVRERTLIEIARTFPSMTALEFRRSLLHLVQQSRKSRQPIQNHNAWLKAAFVKNEGPLVTERMIEAQLDNLGHFTKGEQGRASQGDQSASVQADFDALRRYLTANTEDRAAIDQAAHEKAASVLHMMPREKHAELMEHVIIECAREFFARDTKPSQ